MDGTLYGLAFALYIACARSLYLQLDDRDWRKQNLFTLVYMTIIMALSLYGIAVDSRDIQISFFDHADYPGTGGLGYSSVVFTLSPIAIGRSAAALLLTFMMSGIQIWRLWVVWGASRYSLLVVVLPVLSFLADLGFQMAGMIMFARSELAVQHLGTLFLYGQYVPELCISVTVTIPIVIRIFMVRRRNMEIMGQTANTNNPYTSVISILIESFALEFVWVVLQVLIIPFLSSGPVGHAIGLFVSANLISIQLLSYLLVVYRVTTGRGWKEDTEEKLTSLQWNRDGLQTTQSATQTSVPSTHEEA